MSVALFDPEDIMRAVRAAGLQHPATVATRLQNEPEHSHVAAVATSPDKPTRLSDLPFMPCPDDISPWQWAVIIEGAERFAQQWADPALSLGWTFDELFALREPFANVSLQGAVWFIDDSTVTAVTADAITLCRQGGATQRIYRRLGT